MNSPTPPATGPVLERRLGLLPASALNMANMLGAGPFITISTLMSAMAGPQSMLGWIVALLYRRIDSIGKLLVGIWIGVLIAVAGVLITGAMHFDPKLAFDFPTDAFRFSWGFALGLGAAARTGIYDFLGYYDVCYLGDEVKDPGHTIPRSILISLAGVGWTFVYCTLPLSVMLFSVAALIGAILLYIVWRKGTTEPSSPTAS